MKRFLDLLGIDKTVAYTLGARGWNMLSGFLTLLLIVHFLSADEQGYYYTFASVLAMQVVFELGMSYVIMQFASHEMAHLQWSSNDTIVGSAIAKSRLRSLILLIMKWYGAIAAFIVFFILPGGWFFFHINQSSSSITWQGPWIWLVMSAAVNIYVMPLMALLEGCGRIAEVARLRMLQNIVGSIAAWSVLIGGGGLYAASVLNTGFALTVLLWLWKTKRNFFRDLLSAEKNSIGINWKKEIWPFQMKIALSSLCGFFIFQFFTPVIFAYRGVVEAGQIGMSINIANAVANIAMAWMNSKAPNFGSLIAKKNYVALDAIFFPTLLRSLAILGFLSTILCAVIFGAHETGMKFASRFLDPWTFLLLMLATTLNYISYAQAAYLRAHKEDPFLVLSVVCAVLIGISTMVLGRRYGADGAIVGFFMVSCFIGVGWGSKIFFSKRKEWQISK
ncbi:lipopolysaccharide biosynthesis protein [Janthinobacterium sp. PAMC25594]|uniref:lipopolysaccharide biosynthesis protein n=1 Tax=Janthinobacterium sp. PAMC25594 TaxID=2861284 RepID=UPI001C638863|nr:hypothetical protein [Janthinobacterium sp. PAMC25594]QYG05606.1 hypothetical protein KY494_20125 [Janthinobacterium sp. PAMC25594]